MGHEVYMTSFEEIDRDQAQEPAIVIEGIQYVQSTQVPPCKIYIHPFTLGKILKERTVNLIRGGKPDPLSEDEQRTVDHLAEMDRYEAKVRKNDK